MSRSRTLVHTTLTATLLLVARTSFVKFDEGSGYTQYAGFWTTVLSEYHISKPLYDYCEGTPLPPVNDETVEVPGDPREGFRDGNAFHDKPIPNAPNVPEAFEEDIEKRLNDAGEGHNGIQTPHPKTKGPRAPGRRCRGRR